MGQHFLLSPQVRDSTITEFSSMRGRTAKKRFRQARWPETDIEPYCPHYGNLRCYGMSRERFKCSAKDKPALQLSRELGSRYKTAWVLLLKLREVVASRREGMVHEEEEVEIDGKYAGGRVRVWITSTAASRRIAVRSASAP